MKADLSPASVEAVARRVVELIEADAPKLVEAAMVASRLGRSRDWVYLHATELGAVRLGDGDRPRHGFDPEKMAEYVVACETSRRTEEPAKPAVVLKSPRDDWGEWAGNGDSLPNGLDRGAEPISGRAMPLVSVARRRSLLTDRSDPRVSADAGA
jgi:hypothetical protein